MQNQHEPNEQHESEEVSLKTKIINVAEFFIGLGLFYIVVANAGEVIDWIFN